MSDINPLIRCLNFTEIAFVLAINLSNLIKIFFHNVIWKHRNILMKEQEAKQGINLKNIALNKKKSIQSKQNKNLSNNMLPNTSNSVIQLNLIYQIQN